MQRHRHDSTTVDLPDGFSDPKSARYVEVGMRDEVRAVPPAVTEAFTDELRFSKGPMIQQRGKQVHVIEPGHGGDDLTTGVLWKQISWVRTARMGRQVEAEIAASNARHFTCSSCAAVQLAGGPDATRQRAFPGGVSLPQISGRCALVIEGLIAQRVGAEKINGRTRAELAAALLERSGP